MKNKTHLVLALFLIIWTHAFSNTDVLVESIVKINSTYSPYNYYQPWQMSGVRNITGSGCIIDNQHILTAAHLISDATLIQVERVGLARRFFAHVEYVSHELDLALLKVDDPLFFQDTTPFTLGHLPEVGEEVITYGFPQGGDHLAITKGIVSRINRQQYSHSNSSNLVCQIDASINSGSSGGPVLSQNKIVGIAFELGQGENIGYMIPVPVINHFLLDLADKKLNGSPGVPINTQYMFNQMIRDRFQIPDNDTGVMIVQKANDFITDDLLKIGDIIIAIDEYNVANDGTIEIKKNYRVSFFYAFEKKQINDIITIKLIRSGKKLTIQYPLKYNKDSYSSIPTKIYDQEPTYYIICGIVICPLTVNLLQTWGDNWWDEAPRELTQYYSKFNSTEKEEIVVISFILDDPINIGYPSGTVIEKINGQKIKSVKDLINKIENYDGELITLETLNDNYKLVFPTKDIPQITKRILDRYLIHQDRSNNLLTE